MKRLWEILRRWLPGTIALVMFSVALVVLFRSLRNVRSEEVWLHVESIGATSVVLAVSLTIVSYLVLTLYDSLALSHVGFPMSWRESAPTSFSAFAIGHSVGFTALSGGAIRYRAYSLAGLDGRRIARVVVFCTATFFLGSSLLLGIVLAVDSQALLHSTPMPRPIIVISSLLLIGAPLIYVAWSLRRELALRVNGWHLQPPTPQVASYQLLLGVGDMLIASYVLYALMTPGSTAGFLPFLGVYLFSLAVSSFSNVPGGLGVFEGTMLVLLPEIGKAELLASLVAFRLVYFVLPLAVAVVVFLLQLLAERRQRKA